MGNGVNFLVDFMCGRLAKWLRFGGYNTEYYKSGDKGIIQKAKKENRIIITRNSLLKDLPNIIFLPSENTFEQLSFILKKFPAKKILGRCPLCNTPLKKVNKDEVLGKVPLYVLKMTPSFYYCSHCDKYYWEGSHTKEIISVLRSIH